MRFLIANGADVNARNNNGWPALQLASSEGHLEIMRILVEGGVDVNARYSYDTTALLWAIENGRSEVVRFLVEGGADVNIRNNDWQYGLDLELPIGGI